MKTSSTNNAWLHWKEVSFPPINLYNAPKHDSVENETDYDAISEINDETEPLQTRKLRM